MLYVSAQWLLGLTVLQVSQLGLPNTDQDSTPSTARKVFQGMMVTCGLHFPGCLRGGYSYPDDYLPVAIIDSLQCCDPSDLSVASLT